MKRAALRSLAPGLLASCLTLSVGGGALGLALQNLRKAQAEERLAQDAAHTARAKFERLQREAPQMRRMQARLDALLKSALIGPPPRLEWAERMQALARQHRLDDLRFEIEPPRKLGSLDRQHHYVVYGSRMRIEASLLDEGAALRLLAELEGPVPGQARPTRCALHRLPMSARGSNTVQLQCDVDWLSILPPASLPGAAP